MSDEKRPTSDTQPRGMMGQGGRRGMMPGEKPKDFSGTVKRLLAYFKPEMIRLIIVVILTITSVVFTVYAPRILGNATNELFKGIISKQLPPGVTKDQVIAMLKARGQDQFAEMISNMDLVPGAGVDFGAIGKILLTLAVIYLLAALFQWLQQYIMAGVSQRTVYRLRRDVDQKLQRLPLKYYDSHPHGDILSRVTNDVDNIAHTLQQTITQMLSSIVTVIGVLIMMFKISTLLSWISLAVIPVSLVITLLIARQSQKQFIRQWNSTGAVNAHVEEMFTGHNLVKAFNREKDVLERFRQQNEKLYESSFKAQFISGLIHPVINFVNNLNYVAIAVLGGVNVANGVISLGDVQAFIQYSRQFTQPIVQVASIMNVLQSTVASAERVFELLDEEEEVPDVDNPVVLEDVKGNVRFEHVYFSYDPNVPLIEDFNLDVPAGDMIAIVGPTGAGKTTLVNLLMRFYDVNSGRITIDGVDIKQMRRRDLRKIFGMVLQDTWLFSGTIRDNIAYGKENATEEEIIAAAKAAYVDHFVRTLPDAYDTVLTGDATNISQGQRQLITIARAFLADPKILILDEATSSVDTRTEMLIQKAMQNLMKGRTSFVIAHRLSTIREADNIVVMDHGRIVEQGNHKQLMEKKGFYYNLYMSQFMGALVDEAM
ncbi:MAG TPA: ABC transporter ATP-binding protein [Coprothermobacter proteolyticus]|uniref:ABC transporter ATP-binding protein n=1 Tax=Coprothermobacter proteolyticus TaxID=35786 RepID=UPI000D3132F8|nr:ABC transporter ATP-binding protein [Coprothermobacter proteolyticus]HOK24396.1 ABC transporter ATP-binding protein [Coprothermobacter proteolyticus]HOL53329.1 ABC transporter ATP-binding protein [Coprothermobacter proteolyticus]HPZ44880.1 ABC transporter ATP-binding protein [Coprothermobacter proteolyticus]